VLLFLYLTAQIRPVLSFVLALVAILLMFGGVVGLVLSVDVRKPAVVYDVDMLQRLQSGGAIIFWIDLHNCGPKDLKGRFTMSGAIIPRAVASSKAR
jgi:hypothetical protein